MQKEILAADPGVVHAPGEPRQVHDCRALARRVHRSGRGCASATIDPVEQRDVGAQILGDLQRLSVSALFARRVGLPPSRYRARARRLVQVPALSRFDPRAGCLSLMAFLPPAAFSQFSRSRA